MDLDRICIDNAILDPDPSPGAKKYGITEFQHLKKAFVPTFFLRPITFLKFIFHAKIQLL